MITYFQYLDYIFCNFRQLSNDILINDNKENQTTITLIKEKKNMLFENQCCLFCKVRIVTSRLRPHIGRYKIFGQ